MLLTAKDVKAGCDDRLAIRRELLPAWEVVASEFEVRHDVGWRNGICIMDQNFAATPKEGRCMYGSVRHKARI